jgi:molybdopterin/thiamine biosynthesis adenylyltransferase
MHSIHNVGMNKTDSAKSRILSLNPDCEVLLFNERLNAENVIDIISQFDLVVDGTDNFPTRYLLNDASILTKTQSYMVLFSDSRVKSAYLIARMVLAIVACYLNLHRQLWLQAVQKLESLEFCQE